DEAHMIGLGKYLDIHGYTDRFGILLEHLNKVIEIAQKYDFEPIMWSDMFFRLANKGSYYSSAGDAEFLKIKDKTPKNVGFVYWDYYGKAVNHYKKMIKSHRKFENELWFAGGARSWKGFAPSNRYSLLTMKPAMKACKDSGINNIFITMWGDDGKECSYYSLLPSLFAIRKFYDGEYDMKTIKDEFNRITGEKYDVLYSLDLVDLAIRKDNYKIGFSKAMLYSDPFNGFLDRHVISGDFEKHFKKYKTLSARYAKYKKSSAYGYIFDEESKLCKLLSVKTDLGAKTRIAYANRDVSALKNLVEDYKKAEKYLEDFYRAFKELWYKENKPQGFDIQEVRLGGLSFRLRSCRERLTEYVEGKIEIIPELEEKLLDENGGCEYKESTPEFDKWNKSFTVNVVEHRPI
ncbi:MAG: hypothetical protein J5836_00390, partial [Clostridia bacterium]|nr:hypothetical protein [Clostridia bacterium]